MPGANLTRVEAQERRRAVSGPVHYQVDLDLTVGADDFGSTTSVSFNAVEGSSTFLDLIADEVSDITLNGRHLDPSQAYADSRIELAGLAARNEVVVRASCRYSNTGEGLHRSVDPSDGNVYLYTQFEVPDARRVYAVFDQPDIKAVFDFSVLAPTSWIVTGNMPVRSTRPVDGLTQDGTMADRPNEAVARWVFESTPTMSSYLTAICAGPYAQWHSEYANEDGRTIPMAMYCRQALKDSMQKDVDYLFDITKKGFAFYAKTWGVPYPYAKYDQIYVPEYNAGAMENIGMVTIRDQYVFSSKVTQAMAERRVVTVLHELAHMWFGDYVTMQWWNDLWLNESFAEFTSTMATCEATQWHDAWATFNSGEKSWALRQDQLPTTHPIVAPIDDLNDTYVNFDGITYAKGASVLKQLVAYVGRDRFFEGIHHYLDKHAYGNATLSDLLAELELTSGRDLKQWSSQWLEGSGINTISTDVTENPDGTIASLVLTQSAPEDHPILRTHRLAVGFYNRDKSGRIVRTDRFELDVHGRTTSVDEAAGRVRPEFIAVNDDDLTYTKLRYDPRSLSFALDNLHAFTDPLARSVIWLTLWDMTRDGQLPAEEFIDVSLAALATEHESTTFRYALAQIGTTAWQYVPPARRRDVIRRVAHRLWKLAEDAPAGSDEQFQLVSAYLGFGGEDDGEFISHVQGLLDGSVALPGLTIDNNLAWAVTTALATVNRTDDKGIARRLAENETTENREFALGARASISTREAKAWAWDQAVNNAELTNMQLEAVAGGFAGTHDADLIADYPGRYFDMVDTVWKTKSFHMAEVLLGGLYPAYADPSTLVSLGDAWLAGHEQADAALRKIIIDNVESSRRTMNVVAYNGSLRS